MYRSLVFKFKIPYNIIVREEFTAICTKLKNKSVLQPIENLLTNLSAKLYGTSYSPNCCGVINGKHIVCPADSKSMYFNYKSFFSFVLLTLVNAN